MIQLLSFLLFVALASGFSQPLSHPSSRVVNGEDAVPYSWPWQVSLQYEKDGAFYHTCGGSLIAADWVVTAGHCISRGFQKLLSSKNARDPEGSVGGIPEVKYPAQSWGWSLVWLDNDIALVKLSRSAQLGDKVQLASLPPAGDILPNEAPCYISGWGRLYTGGPLPDKLQEALLPVVDYEHCSQWDWWGFTVKKTMVCAGGDVRSGCNGDSGGPLNCPAADGSWQVHGVTSFVSAFGCNTIKKPTVFTRVSAFIDWIDEVSGAG
ncbi:hypothetical protein K5549_005772 [Capra hircus]|nr:hypothetical protein K5549_005772 [Capra hircus]